VLSFEDACRIAATFYPVNEQGSLDRGRYWFIAVHQIGCIGVVVEKEDGRATPLGSSGATDAWLWGYEQGFLEAEEHDLVITEVLDLDATLNVAKSIARVTWHDFQKPLPLILSVTESALVPLFEDRGRSFRWHLQRADTTDPARPAPRRSPFA